MLKSTLYALFTSLILNTTVLAEDKPKKIMISPDIYSIDVEHKGQIITIKRNQNRENIISKYYQKTHRGKIQAINPFKPHAVETIGTLEMIHYLKQKTGGDNKLKIIDSRTKVWVKRGTIPGTANIPFTEFKNEERALEIMEDELDVLNTGSALNFANAKTIVMYCNGIWCGQSPAAIRTLLKFGYPAAKIKYYRGGMQNWESLGLTIVKP
ncbi:MAG: sulfurtransferase [endosymbiont of Galathealinum brachiosum]|uniref:Sulfurtransferase n=1 Tax=endosymbiont of Galathealinum brachiosum TaxID=2200906 RepID=A0A370DAL5_9GAMM|nr:MAG: sulfurtransferase [endosymbiont of Galathealinum brachiosum]